MGGEIVLAGEIIAGLIFLLLLGLAWLILRRTVIGRDGPLMLVARHDGDRWRNGLARLGPTDTAWFPVIGFRFKPRYVWERSSLDLGAPQPVTGQRPLVIVDPVSVDVTVDDDAFTLAMARGDYTAWRSWTESAPPGINSNVAN